MCSEHLPSKQQLIRNWDAAVLAVPQSHLAAGQLLAFTQPALY